MASDTGNTATPKIRLLDEVRERELTYVDWIKRYILFQGKRHPRDLWAQYGEAFLTDLAG